MTAETIVGAIGRNVEFRTCQYTGLKVDVAAQTLIKANAVAAVVFLAVGGLMGLLVALTRWPVVHLLPAEACAPRFAVDSSDEAVRDGPRLAIGRERAEDQPQLDDSFAKAVSKSVFLPRRFKSEVQQGSIDGMAE